MFNIYYKSKKEPNSKEILNILDKDSNDIKSKMLLEKIKMCDYNIKNSKDDSKKQKYINEKNKILQELNKIKNS